MCLTDSTTCTTPMNWHFRSYLFMKVTMYMRRGVQIIGWSVRIALMACFTQYSGFKGGRKGSISFLKELIYNKIHKGLQISAKSLLTHFFLECLNRDTDFQLFRFTLKSQRFIAQILCCPSIKGHKTPNEFRMSSQV